MEQLAKLFGSALKVKIMRLFLFQEGDGYTELEVMLRTQSRMDHVRKELRALESAEFLICKKYGSEFEEVIPDDLRPKKGPGARTRRTSKLVGYTLNKQSPLLGGLRELLVDSNFITHEELQKHFSGFSLVKLLLLSGVFVKTDSKADMLIVGEKIDAKKLANTIKSIESEIGTEIRYSVFTPDEFVYRIGMYDKYILDILAAPHERPIERMEIPKP